MKPPSYPFHIDRRRLLLGAGSILTAPSWALLAGCGGDGGDGGNPSLGAGPGVGDINPPSTTLGVTANVGSLSAARFQHTATVLGDGRILIAGGRPQVGPLPPFVDLYDPATGLIQPANALPEPRFGHSATVLPDGSVLLAGGFGQSGKSLASAFVFNSVSGLWSSIAPMKVPRAGHTATLTLDGRLFVVSDLSAQWYDPSNDRWWDAAPPSVSRSNHTMTSLRDGTLMMAGGSSTSGGPGLDAIEIYDPLLDSWSRPNPLIVPRVGHCAVLLPDGRVLIAFGEPTGRSGEIYDPDGEISRLTAPSTLEHGLGSTAVILPSGQPMFLGGNSNTGEIFDVESNTWQETQAGQFLYATATLLPIGKVLITGGMQGSMETALVSTYDLATPRLLSDAPPLLAALSGHTSTLLADGQVLVVGALSAAESISNLAAAAQRFDPVSGSWSNAGPLAVARSGHTATRLIDGRVLVVGGVSASGKAIANSETYDAVTGVWATIPSTARAGHVAVLLANGMVMVSGGIPGKSTAELFDPASNSWTGLRDPIADRTHGSGQLQTDGTVMLAGGVGDGPEIYDVTTGLSVITVDFLPPMGGGLGLMLLPSNESLITGGTALLNEGIQIEAQVHQGSSLFWDDSSIQPMTTARTFHTVTLLPDGAVWIAGGTTVGGTPLMSSERLDRTARINTLPRPDGTLRVPRSGHTATLLLDGRILIVGGAGSDPSTEFSSGPENAASVPRPVIDAISSRIHLGSAIGVLGHLFRGGAEGSSGSTSQSSIAFPMLNLRHLDSGRMQWLPVDPVVGWSDQSFTSLPLTDFPLGPALVTVFVGGVASAALSIVVIA